MKWQLSRRMQVAAGGLVLLAFVIPTATTVSTSFVLEPGGRAFVRAETSGWVESVKVTEGQAVVAGTLVGVLRNPEVKARAEILARRLESEERALAAAQARGDIARFREHWQRSDQMRVELARAQAREAKLILRAPLAGVVTTPRLAERLGQFLAEGDTFCEIADRQTMRARVLVPDREVEEIRVGDPVKLIVEAYPFAAFHGRVENISPAAAPDLPPGVRQLPARRGLSLYNYLAVELRFPNPGGELQEGMTGTAKIYGRSLPVALRVARTTWRWARKHIW